MGPDKLKHIRIERIKGVIKCSECGLTCGVEHELIDDNPVCSDCLIECESCKKMFACNCQPVMIKTKFGSWASSKVPCKHCLCDDCR